MTETFFFARIMQGFPFYRGVTLGVGVVELESLRRQSCLGQCFFLCTQRTNAYVSFPAPRADSSFTHFSCILCSDLSFH